MKNISFLIFLAAALGANAASASDSGSVSKAQAGSVLQDNSSAQSSANAGRTYEGSAAAGGPAAASEVSMPGATQPTSLPAPPSPLNAQDIPTPKGVNGTPWQKDIDLAVILIGIAVGLLLIPVPRSAFNAISWIVTALGAAVIALGAKILSQYGQTMQGGILTGIGAVLVIMGQVGAWGNWTAPVVVPIPPLPP